MKLSKAILDNLSEATKTLGNARDSIQNAADVGQTDFDDMSEKRQESPSGQWLLSKVEEMTEIVNAIDDLLNDVDRIAEPTE